MVGEEALDSRDEQGSAGRSTPCFIVDRNSGIWVFHSYHEAEGWVEAVDVADGEYYGFDVEGYALAFDVVQTDIVVISRTGDPVEERATEELRNAARVGGIKLRSDSLPEMVDELLKAEATVSLVSRILRKMGIQRSGHSGAGG